MVYVYDDQNIFAKILRGEIPNKTVIETEYSLAFHDIAPQAPIHVLLIPKGPYICHDHFVRDAQDHEILDFMRTSGKICDLLNISGHSGEAGYRTISNTGRHGCQEVPHYHLHFLGGRVLGPLLSSSQ